MTVLGIVEVACLSAVALSGNDNCSTKAGKGIKDVYLLRKKVLISSLYNQMTKNFSNTLLMEISKLA